MELKRVIVHGVLHLLGYGDSTENERALMRKMEDHYLITSPEYIEKRTKRSFKNSFV